MPDSAASPSDPLLAVAALPGVPDAVAAARTAVDRLLGHRVLRRRSAEVSAESALRGARASAALDGADIVLEAFRAGAGFTDDPDGDVARAALRVSAEVGSLLDVWGRAPLQALARLHAVAAADVRPEDEVGRPRTGPSALDPLDLGSAPSPDEVSARLDGLAAVLTVRSQAPAVVVAAVVHGELLALRPFTWGNGLVARAASRLVLVTRGLDPKALSVPEVGHVELGGRTAYVGALRGYLSGAPDGVAGWVAACARAVELGAREGLAVCEAIERG